MGGKAKFPDSKRRKTQFSWREATGIEKKCRMRQSEVVARLQRKGWSGLNEPVFSMLERGKRGLSDWETKLILDALGAKWRDLE